MRKFPLNFKNKPWESIGLVTDTHKTTWNYGFVDGFNHMVYACVIFLIARFGLAYTPLSAYAGIILFWFPVGVFVFFWLEELYQAFNMRKRTSYQYWQFWMWCRCRHQDYALPTIGVVILFYLTM